MTEVRSTSKDLKMIFNLENGKTHTLSLANPKANLEMNDVTDIADTMVSKEFLIVGGSPIAGMKDAYIKTETIEELA